MQPWYLPLAQILLLVTALSIDSFVASLAYGASKIRIPPLSVAVITLICSLVLGVSLLFGSLIRPFVPAWMTKIICSTILIVLGLVKLFDSSIKHYIQKHKQQQKQISFSALHLTFILKIYANPVEADSDQSHILSPKEAGSLAAALSLDGLAAGFGAALGSIHLPSILLCSFLANLFAVILGSMVGNRIAKTASLDLSWLSGVMLIMLGCFK